MRLKVFVILCVVLTVPWLLGSTGVESDNYEGSNYVKMTIIVNEEGVQFLPDQVVSLQTRNGKDSLDIELVSSIEWATCFIDFPYGSPFDTVGTTSEGHLLLTGLRGRSEVGYHKFSLVCRGRDGTIVVKIDPGVDVDNENDPLNP